MNIDEIKVDGFGVWKDLRLKQLSPALGVFYGPNEAGKSTLMQFVRAALFGFDEDRRSRFLPPLEGGRPGGSLAVDSRWGRFRLHRYENPETPAEGPGLLDVQAIGGANVEGEAELTKLVSNLDEAIFRNVYAFGLRELQELGTLSDSGAAEWLYRLSTGLDRVSLVDVIRELTRGRERLISTRGEPSQLLALVQQRRELVEQIEAAAGATDKYVKLSGQRQKVEQEVAELQRQIATVDRQVRLVELATNLRQNWQRRVEVRELIEMLGEVRPLRDDCLKTLDGLNTEIHQSGSRLTALRRQRNELRTAIERLGYDHVLWQQGPRIEALVDQREWITMLETQLGEYRRELGELQAEADAQQERIGLQAESAGTSLNRVQGETIGHLKPLARTLTDTKKQSEEAEQKLADARKRVDELQLEMKRSLTQKGQEELSLSLETAGERVTQLRRRVKLDERIDSMLRQKEDLEDECDNLLESSLVPGWLLASLGGVFVFGLVLIAFGLMFPTMGTSSFGMVISCLGLIGAGGATGTKFYMERAAAQRFDAAERQLEALGKQLAEAKKEREHLDSNLPAGGGPLSQRLEDAEHELDALEELLPLDARLQGARTELETATAQLERLQQAYKVARSRWRSALETEGLPSNLTPTSLKKIATGRGMLGTLQRRTEQLRGDITARERSVAALRERIATFLRDLGRDPGKEDPVLAIARLQKEHAAQQGIHEQRVQMRRELKELGRRLTKARQTLTRLEQQRLALLGEAGTEDEEVFRTAAERLAERRRLDAQLAELERLIEAAVGTHFKQTDVAPLLDEVRDGDLERRWEELAERQQNLEGRLAELFERRGRLAEQIKRLSEDRSLAEMQLDLDVLDAQLDAAVDRWRVLASTSRILDRIKHLYERERQPQTLAAASEYFARLTDGAYRRIWTPLEEDVLWVEDAQGRTLSVELLSCGTREQLFLSLRLALVEAFANHGEPLPLVMDDLLVNFDSGRALLAARVLMDFAAQGHQLLMFTCHEHIARLFSQAGADVRTLPARNGGPRGVLPPAAPVVEIPAEPEPEPEPEPVPAPPEPEPVAEVIPLKRKKKRKVRREPEPPPAPPEPEVIDIVPEEPEEETFPIEEPEPSDPGEYELAEVEDEEEPAPSPYLGLEAEPFEWEEEPEPELAFEELEPEPERQLPRWHPGYWAAEGAEEFRGEFAERPPRHHWYGRVDGSHDPSGQTLTGRSNRRGKRLRVPRPEIWDLPEESDYDPEDWIEPNGNGQQ